MRKRLLNILKLDRVTNTRPHGRMSSALKSRCPVWEPRGHGDTVPLCVWSVVCSFNDCNTRILAARRAEDGRQVHSTSCRVGMMLSGSLSG